MPDSIGSTGLSVKTASEITADLAAGMRAIYGADINIDSNSPDGQMIGILTQLAVDLRELLAALNASFDPDQAEGTLLDQRVAINNIQRIGGTYTIQPIHIVVNATITLEGLDADFNNPLGTAYTVQDSSGNQFLLNTTATLVAGAYDLDFRAFTVGAVSVPINTITIPVTVIPGVVSVNNPTVAITVGQDEETDGQLRLRRQQSVSNASTGYLNGLLGKILALEGVTEAALYENNGSTTDARGIPAHAIWLIVAGGSNTDIGNTIYGSKSYGCDMRGAMTLNITTASGAIFTAKWDVPLPETLYIQFNIKRTVPGFAFSTTAIKDYIAANLNYGVGAYAETSNITAVALLAIISQGGGGVPVDVKISNDNATWVDYLDTATPQYEWAVSSAYIFPTVI